MAVSQAVDGFILSVGRETWELFKRDALMFVLAWVIVLALSIVSLGLVAGPLMIGMIEMVRRSRHGEPVALGILFSRFDTLVASFIALLLTGLAVSLGFLLLVVPGLLAAVFATYVLHVLAYEPVGAIGALRRSVEITRESFVHTLALVLFLALAQTVGGLVLLGVLVTAPISFIALTVGYERLTGRDGVAAEVLSI